METVVIYSAKKSNRLQYALDWLFRERLQLDYKVTSAENDIAELPFFISYGKSFPNSFLIPDEGLLWEHEINVLKPETGLWHNIPTLFARPNGEAKGSQLPFDIFSAVFFLLSRYEEYYSYKADKHNRYPATNSILYKNGWLQRPLVDEWVMLFGKQL
jgi:hypothetical protein